MLPTNISYEFAYNIDINDLYHFDKNNDKYHWKQSYFEGKYQILVAKNNEELCGFVIYNELDNIEILRIVVAEKYRNNGIASRFISMLQKKNSVILEVRKDNDSAIALYAKCNFEIIHTRKHYYNDNTDGLIMKYNKL